MQEIQGVALSKKGIHPGKKKNSKIKKDLFAQLFSQIKGSKIKKNHKGEKLDLKADNVEVNKSKIKTSSPKSKKKELSSKEIIDFFADYKIGAERFFLEKKEINENSVAKVPKKGKINNKTDTQVNRSKKEEEKPQNNKNIYLHKDISSNKETKEILFEKNEDSNRLKKENPHLKGKKTDNVKETTAYNEKINFKRKEKTDTAPTNLSKIESNKEFTGYIPFPQKIDPKEHTGSQIKAHKISNKRHLFLSKKAPEDKSTQIQLNQKPVKEIKTEEKEPSTVVSYAPNLNINQRDKDNTFIKTKIEKKTIPIKENPVNEKYESLKIEFEKDKPLKAEKAEKRNRGFSIDQLFLKEKNEKYISVKTFKKTPYENIEKTEALKPKRDNLHHREEKQNIWDTNIPAETHIKVSPNKEQNKDNAVEDIKPHRETELLLKETSHISQKDQSQTFHQNNQNDGDFTFYEKSSQDNQTRESKFHKVFTLSVNFNDTNIIAKLKNNTLNLSIILNNSTVHTINTLKAEITSILKEQGFNNFNLKIETKGRKIYYSNNYEKREKREIDVKV